MLNHKEIGIEMGICEEAYEKISAIVVYTSSLNSIIFQDLRYLWSTRRFAIMPNLYLNSSLLNDRLLLKATDMDYKKNQRIPRVMCDFKTESHHQLEISPENIDNIKIACDLNELITHHALR